MPITRKSVFKFAAEEEASLAAAMIMETPDYENVPFALEEGPGFWKLDVYDGGTLAESTAGFWGAEGDTLRYLEPAAAETVPEADWVSITQSALPPVRAGRFLVHGSHDRAAGAFTQWSIEIDAGRAFGTAHHSTTLGCLLAIDRLAKTSRIATVLDLGTGSGVLAIAAVKALQHRCSVTAIDIDPIAIAVAKENALINGAAPKFRFSVGDGIRPAVAAEAFDLVIANILAKPLLDLVGPIRRCLRVGGCAVLSGFLREQTREIVAVYGAAGFAKVRLDIVECWTTAVLRRNF